MDVSGQNGGPFSYGMKENEDAASHRSYRSLAYPPKEGCEEAGEAGTGQTYVTNNGRNVNKEDCAVDRNAIATEKCLPCRLESSCVMISAAGGDHSGMNGFSESLGRGERMTVGLDRVDRGEGVGGHAGGGRGTAVASCPAALAEENGMFLPLGRVSETCAGPRRDSTGENGRETPDSGDFTPVYQTRAAIMPYSGQHRQNCTFAPVSDIRMPNGDVNIPGYGSHEVDINYCAQSEVLSHRLSAPNLGFNNHGREEVKAANGGCHIICTRAPCDHHEPDYCAENNKKVRTDRGSHQADTPAPQSPGQEEAAVQLPRSLTPPGLEFCEFAEGSPIPESSATLSSLSFSNCTGESPPIGESPPTGENPPTENSHEEYQQLRELSLSARPHSLRTQRSTTVSLSLDATPLSPEDGGFYYGEEDVRKAFDAGRRQSAPDNLPDTSEHTDLSEQKGMPKRFGIADFFTRSLFSRKPKDPKASSHNATGWRLFGKATESDAADSQQEPSAEVCPEPQRPLVSGRRKQLEFEPLSTTALILEERPGNLPAKSEEEAQRHKQEYQEMVAGAKRRELKEAQRRKRQMKERHRQEESISQAINTWNKDILPHWDTMKGMRRVRELWWQGLPPSVRGTVWSLAIGNDLNITPELYEIFLCRAKERWRCASETSSVNDNESDGGASLADRESSLDLIKLDISRTFPSLFIFQKGGPYHDVLHSLLGAYTCYRPDIGYVQGMSFIAAVLILNLEEAEAFITFANLLNKPCQMVFFRVDHELMLKYFAAFEIFFEENLPRLFHHFHTNNLTPDLYLIDWIFTLYSKALPLDVACRVWDVFCRDGEESLFRTGLGILRLYQDVLLQMDFIHIAQFLTRLPADLPPHDLFGAMASTHMVSRAGRWAQVFSSLMKDGNKEMDKHNSPALRS